MRLQEMKLSMQLGKRDVDYEGDEEEPPELVQARFFLFTTLS